MHVCMHVCVCVCEYQINDSSALDLYIFFFYHIDKDDMRKVERMSKILPHLRASSGTVRGYKK